MMKYAVELESCAARRSDSLAIVRPPWNNLLYRGASIRAFNLLRHFKPDVTFAFFGLPSGAVAWLLRIASGIPYVVSLRGGDVPGFRPYDFWLYHKLAMPFYMLSGVTPPP